MLIEILLGVSVFFLFVICYALRSINDNIRAHSLEQRVRHTHTSKLLEENIAELQKARLRIR